MELRPDPGCIALSRALAPAKATAAARRGAQVSKRRLEREDGDCDGRGLPDAWEASRSQAAAQSREEVGVDELSALGSQIVLGVRGALPAIYEHQTSASE